MWSLYTTGMSASIMREASSQACRLGMYPAARDIVGRLYGSGKGANSGIAAKLSAGIGLGALSAVVASPFDLVRIRLQAEGGRVAADGKLIQTGLLEGLAPRLHGTAQTFATIVRENGLGALWRGLGVNVLRGALMTAATVPVYDHSKHVCLLSASRKNSAGTHTNTKTRHTLAHAHVSMQAHKRRTVPHRQSQTGAHHRRARVISLHVGESWDQSIIMHPAAVEHVHCPPSTLFAVKARDALVRPEGAALIHVHIDLLQVRACRHFDSPCSKTTPHKPTPNTRRNQRDIRDASLLQPSPHARGKRSTAHHPSR